MPYSFGFPDVLVDFHFPQSGGNQFGNSSLPWFWFISPPEQPFYFQYISPQAGGAGWQRTQNAAMIKILPGDTQILQPTPVLGFATIENAIDTVGSAGADTSWGRFQFTDNFFWKVIGTQKPEFTVVQGRPTVTRKTKAPPIRTSIKNAVTLWKNDWNFGANSFNTGAASVLPSNVNGVSYPFPQTKFALPLPNSTDVADAARETFNQLAYLGPVPGGFWFEGGTVQIFKQAYSFKMQVAQLDPKVWDMSQFPPQRWPDKIVTGTNMGGYGQTTFPLAGPQIIGGGGF